MQDEFGNYVPGLNSEAGQITIPGMGGGGTATNVISGSAAISNGASMGSVTGLDLDDTPTEVVLTVRKPDDGLTLFATVIAGTLTTDGFDYELSGNTDSANYYLDYVIVL